MTASERQALGDAVGLTPMERAELIDAPLRSSDPGAAAGADEAWKAEAESRIDALETGELTDDDAEAMFARSNRRLRLMFLSCAESDNCGGTAFL